MNQKGIIWMPIIIWSLVALFVGSAAAVKSGIISTNIPQEQSSNFPSPTIESSFPANNPQSSTNLKPSYNDSQPTQTSQTNNQGCCSYHGGVGRCDSSVGRLICNDGSYSTTCTCPINHPPVQNPSTNNQVSNPAANTTPQLVNCSIDTYCNGLLQTYQMFPADCEARKKASGESCQQIKDSAAKSNQDLQKSLDETKAKCKAQVQQLHDELCSQRLTQAIANNWPDANCSDLDRIRDQSLARCDQ